MEYIQNLYRAARTVVYAATFAAIVGCQSPSQYKSEGWYDVDRDGIKDRILLLRDNSVMWETKSGELKPVFKALEQRVLREFRANQSARRMPVLPM